MKNTSQNEHDKMVRRAVGELALLGLLAEVIRPTCTVLKADAERVLFSNPISTEKRQLCSLLDLTETAFDELVGAALQSAGHNPQTNCYH